MTPNNQLDIVSVEMGRRLKEAGWEREPDLDTYCFVNHTAGLFGPVVELGHTALGERSYRVRRGGWYLASELTCLPRRRDLELALVEMGLWTRTDSGPYEMPGGKLVTLHTCCLRNVEGGVVVGHVDGDTPADAVALAWIEAKGELHEPDR